MDYGLISLAVLLGISLIGLAISFTKMKGFRDRVTQMSAAIDEDVNQLREELTQARNEAARLQERINEWIAEKTEASTKLVEAEKRIAGLITERDEVIVLRETAINAQREAEKAAALRAQELEDIQKRIEDWETAKSESLEAAKAAALATSKELSSKLLEDHKRESDAAKKDAETRVQKTTENLIKQLQDISKVVAALDRSVGENKETMDTVWRALSHPGGAGQITEIGLENTLKSFGLEKGRDYVIQQQIEGKKLRPDAMVFLPGDTVIVIDAKASKHILELAQAEGTDQEDSAYKKLSKTMNQHLRDLANKNYKAEVLAGYRSAGRGSEIRRIMSLMYLHNEAAIEKLKKSDPDFVNKAAKAEIIIAGPASLACLVGFARVEIDLGKQVENHEKIIHGTQSMLDSIGIVIEKTTLVGRGLKSASDNYLKLTSSINSRLIPRVQSVMSMGIRPARSKGIPKNIPGFQMVSIDAGDVIDGESKEIDDLLSVTDQSDNSLNSKN